MQPGGCLQTFTRNGSIFDTGMHYIGGLDEGQILHTMFRYLKLTEKLKIRRLDEDGYDVVRYHGHDYEYAMGYQGFVEGWHGISLGSSCPGKIYRKGQGN